MEMSELARVERELDRMAGRWLSHRGFGPGPGWFARWGADGGPWVPACELSEREGDLILRLELPGIDVERDVTVSVEKGLLRVYGERRRSEQAEADGLFESERCYGAFERTFALPETVAADEISALYQDGVLEIVLPRGAARPAAHTIEIAREGHGVSVPAREHEGEPVGSAG